MDSIILETINKYNMLPIGCKVFIALSGGVDSVVLLYKIKQLQNKLDLEIEALHVNHGIRGVDADNDEQFCIALCKKIGVKISVHKADIPALAKKRKQGIEECAREVRYEYFYKMLTDKGFDVVATAHNLNDNAETLIFNMIRGSGIKGLCGIPPIRDKIIRPLIGCTKQQILSFAKQNHLDFVFDKTNDDKKYTRNYIRHEIIPKVLEINPSFLQSSQKMSSVLCSDDDFLSKQTDEILKKAQNNNNMIIFLSTDLIDLHDAVLSRVIISAYTKISGDNQISYTNIKNAVDEIRKKDTNKIIELPKKVIIQFSYDKIIFKKHNNTLSKEFYFEINKTQGNIFFEQLGITIEYRIEDCNKQFTKKDGNIHINYDIINGNIFFRNRKVSDRFVPLGGTGTKSVKKMLIDRKVPKEIRNVLPVLCCDDEVIWVFGLDRINDKFKPNKDTKKILSLLIKKGGSFFESGY